MRLIYEIDTQNNIDRAERRKRLFKDSFKFLSKRLSNKVWEGRKNPLDTNHFIYGGCLGSDMGNENF